MSRQVSLRKITVADLDAVTEVHVRAFPGAAMTKLGKGAVRRYYEWQLLGPHDVHAFAAFKEGKCLGFLFGGVFRGSTSGFLRKNRLFLLARLASRPWLLGNPLLRERLRFSLGALRRSKQKPAAAKQKTGNPQAFGILSIAVDPRSQGLGVGKLLMAEAEERARRSGFCRMELTVHPGNSQALQFYESQHWVRYSAGGDWEGAMRKNVLGAHVKSAGEIALGLAESAGAACDASEHVLRR